mmetsp:Transcript_1748/g.3367  ORF Transcript_1748/g.3367 Transcript_1748/m.3367 type:complete len:98 (-) Transcript_1748:1018-1311(-)
MESPSRGNQQVVVLQLPYQGNTGPFLSLTLKSVVIDFDFSSCLFLRQTVTKWTYLQSPFSIFAAFPLFQALYLLMNKSEVHLKFKTQKIECKTNAGP